MPISATGDLHSMVDGNRALRVGTYNVQSGKGRDGIRDSARAASVITAADLVGLQEISGPSHIRQLSNITKAQGIYFPAETRWFREYRGNALLSRLPVRSWTVEPLPNPRHKGFRSLAHAEFQTSSGNFVCFVTHGSKHLDCDLLLAKILPHFLACPRAILLGDLNATRFTPSLRELLQSGKTQDALGMTLGSNDDDGRIDWILTRGFDVLDGGFNNSEISDHPYLWVDLRLSV